VERIRRHFTYARDEALRQRFENASGTWLERALRLGAGDCDVLNGVLVLLLRAVDIPARLEAGLVGVDGRAAGTLHAWTRYYLGDWRTVDVSTGYHSAAGAFPVERVLAVEPRDDTAAPVTERDSTTSLRGDSSPSVAWPVSWVMATVFLLAVLSALAAWWWRRRRRPPVDQAQYIRELFRHHLTFGPSDGSLKLHFRPVFPSLGGGCLSLHQLQKLAGRARLLGAAPGCPLAARLRGRRRFLDASAELVRELTPFLPPVTWLEEWQSVLDGPPLSPAWRQLQDLLDRLDPDIRLHRVAGEACFAEAHLPFREAGRGRFHVRVGDEHPLWTWAGEEIAANGPDGLLAVLEKLTGMLTIAPARRYRLLAAAGEIPIVVKSDAAAARTLRKGGRP
jgi:hypothetical protein